jgi:hypothetical protein
MNSTISERDRKFAKEIKSPQIETHTKKEGIIKKYKVKNEKKAKS